MGMAKDEQVKGCQSWLLATLLCDFQGSAVLSPCPSPAHCVLWMLDEHCSITPRSMSGYNLLNLLKLSRLLLNILNFFRKNLKTNTFCSIHLRGNNEGRRLQSNLLIVCLVFSFFDCPTAFFFLRHCQPVHAWEPLS